MRRVDGIHAAKLYTCQGHVAHNIECEAKRPRKVQVILGLTLLRSRVPAFSYHLNIVAAR